MLYPFLIPFYLNLRSILFVLACHQALQSMLIKQNDNKEGFESDCGELWGKKQTKTKLYSFVMTMAWASLCLFVMDYLLRRLDLKGVTLEKLHNNLAKRQLNKY